MRTLCAIVLLASAALAQAQPLGTAFVYQGLLESAGVPASTPHNVRYSLWDAPFDGNNIGSTLCNTISPVAGRFASVLDFGPVFNGQLLYLQIEVRAAIPNGCLDATGFTTLSPRQALRPAPAAIYALNAGEAQSSATLGGQPPSFFTNASNLSIGTIPDARLATSVARTNIPQTFTGPVTFSNPASSFAGSGALLTALNASNLASGAVPESRLPASVALTTQTNLFAADQAIAGSLRVNAPAALATLHVGGEGYFAQAVRVGDTQSPRAGTIRFNQTSRDFEGYNGAWWRSLTNTTTSQPGTVITFADPGPHTWVVPAGVVSIGIEAWGGGGGGGGSGSQVPQDCGGLIATGGAGGGSGGYGVHIVDVSPGDTISITVGTGGPGGVALAPGIQGGTTIVAINGVLAVRATGGGPGNPGANEPLGAVSCGTISPTTIGGAGGTASFANFSNQSGNTGGPGRRGFNLGGCGFPTLPDIRPGCPGAAGTSLASISPAAASAGQGGIGGQHSGTAGGPGQNGSPGRVRILY